MEFDIQFYRTSSGRCPVLEFFNELETSEPDDFAAVLAGLARLRSREFHRPPLSKALGDDLFQLRHVGKLNTRVLYFFARGRRIILLHGFRKKSAGLPSRERRVALERKRDWIERNPA
jgi:phage-related protein